MIVAVCPEEGYALMLPVRKMVSDIQSLVPDAVRISVNLDGILAEAWMSEARLSRRGRLRQHFFESNGL